MASTYVLERRRKLVDLAARSAVLNYINREHLGNNDLSTTYSSVSMIEGLRVFRQAVTSLAGYSFYLIVDVVWDTPRDSRLEAGLLG